MPRYDVAIVGAGPAGAVTAWILAGLDPALRIILCDATAIAGRKPCGEYLSPGGVGVLERAGLLADVLATGALPLRSLTMRAPAGGIRVPFAPVLGLVPQAGHGLGVRRERFDGCLRAAAARRVEMRGGSRMSRVQRDEDGWTLTFADASTVSARLLVGADGRGSAVRRQCGLDRRPSRQRFALATRARGVAHGDGVEMHLGPLGQVGICPLGDGEANLNLLLAPASAGLLRLLPRERLLRAALAATPGLAQRVRAADIGPVLATGSLPQTCSAVIGDRLALVGDAAGFCDPFTGEGMSLALAEAELLAAAIAGPGLPAYSAAFARTVGRRRRIGESLQSMLSRRRLSEALLAAVAGLPLAARLLVADAAAYRRSA